MIFWVVVVAGGLMLLLLLARFIHFEERVPSRPPGESVHVHQVKTKRRIVLKDADGVERVFESLDEVPEEFRRDVQDAIASGKGRTRVVLMHDGKRREFDSLDDVPGPDRERIRRLAEMGQGGVMIEVNGQRHYFNSPEEVPGELRRFVDEN